ncbi:MAG TPA: ABC transporter ATP-binding protein [Thermopetrobacter sp.]|nr:ABC transporter ATP-binding protein [Thermopetrobacter sp.]
MLDIDDLHTGHGAQPVLFGVSLRIAPGGRLALVGRNGMGKTTLVRALFGLLPAWRGRITFAGRDITGLPSHARARAGLGLVPEGRQIFPNLTVRENLLATARPAPDDAAATWTPARVYELFPELAGRADVAGALLSGGEQQMLAIARALMTSPRLLVLDEACEGLAPLVRRRIWEVLATLAEAGLALLVIDRDLDALAGLADELAVMDKGRIAWRGDPRAFLADDSLKARHLGLGDAGAAPPPAPVGEDPLTPGAS